MSRRRVLGTAAVLMLFATGCGVQPSGVITGAAPPSGRVEPVISDAAPPGGRVEPPRTSVTLYLVSNGKLTPVQRAARPRSREGTLALLASGPTTEERARGLTSEVPPGAAPFSVSVEPPDEMVVTVSGSVDELSDTAIDQIVCTAAEPGQQVTVLVGGRSRGPRACPAPG
jgi:hypothetical protein